MQTQTVYHVLLNSYYPVASHVTVSVKGLLEVKKDALWTTSGETSPSSGQGNFYDVGLSLLWWLAWAKLCKNKSKQWTDTADWIFMIGGAQTVGISKKM